MTHVYFLLFMWGLLIPLSYWLLRQPKQDRSGLSFVYVLLFCLMHLPGAMVLLVEWHARYPRELVIAGVELSLVGLYCFVIGSAIGPPLAHELLRRSKSLATKSTAAFTLRDLRRFALMLVVIGISTRVVLLALPPLPSITALISALTSLVLIGLMLMTLVAVYRDSLLEAARVFALLVIVVLMILLGEGFLGYGVSYVIVMTGFVLTRVRFRAWYIPSALIVVFLGMSIFVTYMRDRSLIRESVWLGESAESRIDSVLKSFADFETFDYQNQRHLTLVDERLNQNVFYGLAAENLRRGSVEYAGGELLVAAMFAIIPRAIWPSKPTVGGGGDVVSRFTGVTFAEDTSVGAGQVLEFYVSYGWFSLIILMMLGGVVVSFIGTLASDALRRNDFMLFTRLMLAGLAFMQPAGNLSEVSSSFVAAVVAGFLFSLAVKDRFSVSVQPIQRQGRFA